MTEPWAWVALGMHRNDRRIVWLSAFPIALGHALAVGVVAVAFVWAGLLVDGRIVRIGAGLVLIGWALYYWRYGHRHRVRFGLKTGLLGLGAWSFLMATGHGAGVMLWPVLMPLCINAAANPDGAGPVAAALLGVGLHTLAMLATST